MEQFLLIFQNIHSKNKVNIQIKLYFTCIKLNDGILFEKL